MFRARVGVNATLAALFLILLMGRVVSAHTDEPNALPAPIATATCQNNTLAVTWNPVAGATEYVYAVGITPTDPGADYAIPWTSSGTAIQANIPGYALVPDTTYFCYVKARDASDNWSNTGVSNSVYVSYDSKILLREDFNYIDYDRWDVYVNGGNVNIQNGILSLSTPPGNRQFPYFRIRYNPFPRSAGFTVSIRIKFGNGQFYGTGFAAGMPYPNETGANYGEPHYFQAWSHTGWTDPPGWELPGILCLGNLITIRLEYIKMGHFYIILLVKDQAPCGLETMV